jgi:hypothetical protein
VAVCCELDASPGAALQRLAGADDAAAAVRAIRKSALPDSLSAMQFARALEDLHIYLLSRLSRSTVEELGAVPVADAQELARLAGGRSSCLLLSGGQHIRVGAEGQKSENRGQRSEIVK